MTRILRRLCCLILGFVLFAAGILKLMDPVGSTLLVGEYLKFFHLSFLDAVSKPLALTLAFAETSLGIALITGVWKRMVAWITLGFLSFFTLITLILLVRNPEIDCGCFGEAVHLTHLQSFVKNLILLALWARYALPMGNFTTTQKIKYASFALSELSVLLFSVYSLFSLPLRDFTDFHPGADLEDVQLSVSDFEGKYCDSLLMADHVALISVYDPAELETEDWIRISDFVADASAAGYGVMLLTASYPDQMSSLLPDPSLEDICYYADRRTIMTLNRSNGGLSILDDAQIVAKWSIYGLPGYDRLVAMSEITSNEAVLRRASSQRLRFQAFLLYMSAVMLII